MTSTSAPNRARGPTRAPVWVVVPLALVAVVVVLVYWQGAFRSIAGVPPVGVVWFGEGYDPTTHTLDRTLAAIPPGRSLVIVGHLIRPGDSGLAIQFSIDGDTFGREIIDGTGGSEFASYAPPGGLFSVAGRYGVVFVDRSGATLASGELTVTR